MRGLCQFVAILTMLVELIMSSINVIYHNEVTYDNVSCRPGDAVFTGSPTSRISCGAQCQINQGCRSYFYNSVDKKCYGCTCSYMNIASSALPSKPGSKFYATANVPIPPPPTIGITPSAYTSDLDIQWTIESPCDMIISIRFYNIHIEDGSLCTSNGQSNCPSCYDYVLVYDGPTDASQRLGMVCGLLYEERTYNSSGPQMFVQFHTDVNTNMDGFASTISFESN